jgi:hypothetical protein
MLAGVPCLLHGHCLLLLLTVALLCSSWYLRDAIQSM